MKTYAHGKLGSQWLYQCELYVLRRNSGRRLPKPSRYLKKLTRRLLRRRDERLLVEWT